ncbi:transposase [Streptomyces sp. NBC_00647]|uniref:Tn3 family transposase n=1 Tax=Streptomyces sp. NBC_00647 TaxID=2975796 RepID=UPI003249BA97
MTGRRLRASPFPFTSPRLPVRQTGSSPCEVSSVRLMRRLSSNSRKAHIYKAFIEVGRVMRTVALLRFLADSGLRARGDGGHQQGRGPQGVLGLDPGSATRA